MHSVWVKWTDCDSPGHVLQYIRDGYYKKKRLWRVVPEPSKNVTSRQGHSNEGRLWASATLVPHQRSTCQTNCQNLHFTAVTSRPSWMYQGPSSWEKLQPNDKEPFIIRTVDSKPFWCLECIRLSDSTVDNRWLATMWKRRTTRQRLLDDLTWCDI